MDTPQAVARPSHRRSVRVVLALLTAAAFALVPSIASASPSCGAPVVHYTPGGDLVVDGTACPGAALVIGNESTGSHGFLAAVDQDAALSTGVTHGSCVALVCTFTPADQQAEGYGDFNLATVQPTTWIALDRDFGLYGSGDSYSYVAGGGSSSGDSPVPDAAAAVTHTGYILSSGTVNTTVVLLPYAIPVLLLAWGYMTVRSMTGTRAKAPK